MLMSVERMRQEGWAAMLAVALVFGCGGTRFTGDGDEPDDAVVDGSGDTPVEGSGDGTDGAAEGGATDARPEVPEVVVTCGDGVLDPGEECDDGNRMNGDECDWACHAGPGTVPPVLSDDPTVEDVGSGDGMQPVDVSDIWTDPFGLGNYATLAWGETVYATLIHGGRVVMPGDPGAAAFLRFGTDGRRVGTAWRYLDPEHLPSGYLDLVWNGDGYGLAWCANEATLWFVELDREGKMLYAPLQPVTVEERCDPTLVWDGERYGLLWTVMDPDTSTFGADLSFVALGHRGVTLTGVVVVHHNPSGGVRSPDASTSGANILVAFVDNPARCGGTTETLRGCHSVATVSREGVVVHAPVVVAASEICTPDTAWGEDRFGVLLDSKAASGEPEGLRLAFFAETGELLGPPILMRTFGMEVVTLASPPGAAALAWGGSGWAVAYVDAYRPEGGPNGGIIRLDRDGGHVNAVPAGMDDDCLARSDGGRWLDMAFDGRGFGLLCASYLTIAFGRFPLEP
jgi:cysteine-rich repeat protein